MWVFFLKFDCTDSELETCLINVGVFFVENCIGYLERMKMLNAEHEYVPTYPSLLLQSIKDQFAAVMVGSVQSVLTWLSFLVGKVAQIVNIGQVN